MKNWLSIVLFSLVFLAISCSEAAKKPEIEAPMEAPRAKPASFAIEEPTKKSTEIESVSKENLEELAEELMAEKVISLTEKDTKAITKELKKTANSKLNSNNKEVEKSKTVVSKEKTSAETTPQTNSASIATSMDQKTTVEEKVLETEKSAATQKDEKPQKSLPNHNLWHNLLQKYVSANGKVNYKGIKAGKSKLQNYLNDLSAHPPQSDWTRKEKMAYWINAYNAFTVKLIVDNYPLSSITNLEGGKPWDKKWIELGGKTYSLNNIENDILRPQYKDARIHFAVNCAAKSCPPLLNKAWTASNLNANFDKQAKAFINNEQFNSIRSDQVEISKIFEWYAVDFGNIIDYLNQYSTTEINADAKVSYREYDWALNE